MVDFKIILYSCNGCTRMHKNMVNKILIIILRMREDYKYWRSKVKNGMKLMYTCYRTKRICIINRMINNSINITRKNRSIRQGHIKLIKELYNIIINNNNIIIEIKEVNTRILNRIKIIVISRMTMRMRMRIMGKINS